MKATRLVLATLLWLPAALPAQELHLSYEVRLATGTNPNAVVVQDLDSDGRKDLVVCYRGDSYVGGDPGGVSVFMGNGDRTFRTLATYATPYNPSALAVADLDSDGAADLVVTSRQAETGFGGKVTVFSGNGDGSFAAAGAASYAVGELPASVAAADLDGDGHADIVVANNVSNDLSVLLGAGDGTFAAAASYPAGEALQGVAVADMDGDGNQDVVVASPTHSGADSAILVLPGFGDGTLGVPAEYPAGSFPHGVAVADFDGDGAPDVAAANNAGNDVSVFLGAGAGALGAPVSYAAGEDPSVVVSADLNGDGFPDLVVGNSGYQYNYVSVLLGRGDGTFAPTAYLPVGDNGPLAVDDLDGDGIADLAALGAGEVVILSGSGEGRFGHSFYLPVGEMPDSVAGGDLDGDGNADLVAAGKWIDVALGNGDGTFAVISSEGTGESQPSAVALVDLNGDAKLDLVLAKARFDLAEVRLGGGDGTFTTPGFRITSSLFPLAVDLAVADLDGDGSPDLAAANSAGGGLSVALSNGDGTFGSPATYAGPGEPTALAVEDFDGDLLPDAVLASRIVENNVVTGGALSFLKGQSGGTFAAAVEIATPRNVSSIVASDFDGDGESDLAWVNSTEGSISVAAGKGDGTFAAAVSYPAGDGPQEMAAGDLDRDGNADLAVISAFSKDVHVLLGAGDGTFRQAARFTSGERPQGLALADADGNGTPDLLVATAPGARPPGKALNDSVTVFLGNLAPQVASFAAAPVAGGPRRYSFSVSASDIDGTVEAARWDFDGDGLVDRTTSALSSVYEYTAPGQYQAAVQVVDDFGTSTTATVAVSTNAAPVAAADAYLTDEDVPLTVAAAGGVLANDTDADGDALTAWPVSGVLHGTLTLAADGSFGYIPDADFNGTDGFTYTAHDGTEASAPALVTLSVSAVNDVPVVAPPVLAPGTVDENGWTTLTGSFTDPDAGDGHSVVIDWGDGSADTAIAVASGSFTVGPVWHQYLDDDPSGTGADLYTVQMRVEDGQPLGTAFNSSTIVVRNVAPVLTALSTSAPVTHPAVSVTAGFADPGTLDSHLCTVDWGDGSSAVLAADGLSCSAAHDYGSPGLYTVTVTVQDDDGGTGAGTIEALVIDNTPPLLLPPPDVTAEATGPRTVVPIGTATASDDFDPAPVIADDAPPDFPLGATTVTWTATDASGNSSTATSTVTVVDTTKPELSVVMDPALLWPPDHKMVRVVPRIEVSDIADPDPQVSLSGITVTGGGDLQSFQAGRKGADLRVDADGSIYLRAERAGKGEGRTYTLTFEASDASGNHRTAQAVVAVPHDMSR